MQQIAVSVVEAGAALGVGRSTMWRLIKRGEVDTIRIGDRRLVVTQSLHRLVERSAA